MIELIGGIGTSERAAGEELAAALERTWPGISASPAQDDHVKILVGAKLSGYRVSDIDLVVAARLNSKRYIAPKAPFTDKDGARVVGAKVRVRSFVAVIEVKDHDAERLRIEAGGVSVKYKGGWESATEQSVQQLHALRGYLQDQRIPTPFIYRCVLLRGINELPKDRGRVVPDAGAVAAGFSTDMLLMAMASVNGVSKLADEYAISSGPIAEIELVLSIPLFTAVVPTALDRLRMDRVASRPALAREIGALLGRQRVHLRGKGGTGKTVLLLQSAHEGYTRHARRCLLLMYNHALASDIQRLLAVMGIPSTGEGGGVDVRSTMSFVYSWLHRLGIFEYAQNDLSDFSDYDVKCKETLTHVQQGSLSKGDIELVKTTDRVQFDYDAILIDEAQDWPQSEADLVCALYGGEAVTLADGFGQLVRGAATDWRASLPSNAQSRLIPLDECLRMKANLAAFANEVAVRAGLNWKLQPSSQARGGRIIISSTGYAQSRELRASLLQRASSAGNCPVDFLHCVPPSGVVASGNQRVSLLAKAFIEEGREAWDGVDLGARRDFPRSTEALRVVQYESCRGLEGWVTILDGLDEFWERKFDERLRATDGADAGFQGLSAEHQARQVAWRWVMMTLTRPIDTLVITVRNPDTELARVLLSAARELKDFVEII